MFRDFITGQIRHLLTGAGAAFAGYLVAKGIATPTDAAALASAGSSVLAGAVMSAYDKYKRNQ